MELRAFAEQVLFATTLEEKLQRPVDITDEQPGAPISAPAAPGRPAMLRFKESGGAGVSFPGVRQLGQERERGRLLHFFANHELLATELMALVLLRFPDAPAAFRRGVLQTLRDEQEHTRLYLGRMRACGIEFGELPVSGYFWRAVSTMENPIDYVAGLCLTFEQANLDFARHFATGFHAVGDDATANLLEKIHRDEIAHVAYGLKWFRRWKNPTESDWEAFCRTLKFPLSPQRAKGFSPNIDARRAAGLDADFIAQLNVYSQSKGRTPGVFVFNPFAEGYIAQGRAFTPAKHLAQLARDLASLPQFLCRQDDIVLVEHRPSVEFLSGIKQAGFALPEFVEMDWSAGLRPGALVIRAGSETGAPLPPSFASRKLGALRPWAWGPDSVELFAPLFANVSGMQRAAEQCFNQNTAALYSKSWSANLFREFLHSSAASLECGDLSPLFHPATCRRTPRDKSRGGESGDKSPHSKVPPPWLCPIDEVGVPVNTVAAALEAIAAIRARGHHKIVVKEALGLAGGNAIRLWEPALLDTQRRWMEGALTHGRELVIEPWLEREMDFSAQLEMTDGGLKLCGFTGLINDRKGQFQANWAAPNFAKRIPDRITALFTEPADIVPRLHRLYADLFTVLEAELRRAGFLGPVGIDSFVYRDPAGRCRLKPIVEINPRYTMGRLTLELMKHVAPGSHGMFRLVSRTMARAEGCEEFPGYARALVERAPLRLEGEPVPRIREGALCLNDPEQAQVCLAVFEVSRGALIPPPAADRAQTHPSTPRR